MTDTISRDDTVASQPAISRDDLEGKLRQIENTIDSAARDWRAWIVGGLAVTAAVMIGVGIWRSKRRSPITVEVYHNP